jgi:hypothetical protein
VNEAEVFEDREEMLSLVFDVGPVRSNSFRSLPIEDTGWVGTLKLDCIYSRINESRHYMKLYYRITNLLKVIDLVVGRGNKVVQSK